MPVGAVFDSCPGKSEDTAFSTRSIPGVFANRSVEPLLDITLVTAVRCLLKGMLVVLWCVPLAAGRSSEPRTVSGDSCSVQSVLYQLKVNTKQVIHRSET